MQTTSIYATTVAIATVKSERKAYTANQASGMTLTVLRFGNQAIIRPCFRAIVGKNTINQAAHAFYQTVFL